MRMKRITTRMMKTPAKRNEQKKLYKSSLVVIRLFLLTNFAAYYTVNYFYVLHLSITINLSLCTSQN